MTPSEIKPEMKFGHWEVIKFDHSNEHRVKYFLCKCDVCGSIRPVRGTSLIDGTSTACSRACKDSVIGMKFGNWTVLQKDNSRPGYSICKCDCGTVKSVYTSTLKNGSSKSCGCLSRQHSQDKNKKNAESHIGEKHGLLTLEEAIVKINNDGSKKYYYKCKCDCGREVTVLGANLFNGNTTSCGCINSKANMRMDQILTKLNIPFKREYKFEDCKDKAPLPFDFALFNNEGELIGLIENNGDQHYSARGTQWNTPERLIYTQKHDYIKQKFAEDSHIPLLIIPYQYFDEIEKFLTTSDFWKIIIKNFND